MPRGEDDDDGSWDEDVGDAHGVAHAPAAEFWSDDETGGGARQVIDPGDSRAEARATAGPWGAPTQRTLGGARVEEPVTAALLWRLLAYALAYSACLTGCEVVTMWASRRVSSAVQPGVLGSLLWGCVRCACLLGLPFWCVPPARAAHAAALLKRTHAQLALRLRHAEAPGRVEGAARALRTWPQSVAHAVAPLCTPQELIPSRRKLLDGASRLCATAAQRAGA